MDETKIILPADNDLNELIEINTYYFAKAEQTNKALKIPDEMYRNYAEHITTKALKQNQIIVAKQNEKILGFLIWEDYCKPLVEGIKANPDVYKLIAPEITFVELLEKKLKENYQFKVGECAKLMQAGVLPEYQNKGIASQLAIRAIEEIKERKYKYVIADCTAENSWHLLIKFGFEILTEIAYSDFVFEGVKTFSSLIGNRRLIIKELN